MACGVVAKVTTELAVERSSMPNAKTSVRKLKVQSRLSVARIYHALLF